MSISSNTSLPSSVAVIASLAVVITAMVSDPASAQQAPGQPVAVSVAKVEARPAVVWDEFSGRLEAIEHVDIRSRVAGVVEKVHFREGALVKAGDPLLTIDRAPYATEVDRLEAQVAAAEARVVFAKSELGRARKLEGSPALSARDLDSRVNSYSEAVANVRASKAALEAARLQLGYTIVRAPVDGRVGDLRVTVGNLIGAGVGAPVLTTLVSVNPIYASFNADEAVVTRAMASLSPEALANADVDKFRVQISTADNGGWVDAHLQLIDNHVDAASGTVRLRAVVANPDGKLIAGQFARVRMARPSTGPVVAITERAIGTDQDRKFVLVVGSDNKASYRAVKLGAKAGRLRIIADGLKPDESIIVAGLQHVRPGSPVKPQRVTMTGQAIINQAHAGADPAKIAQQ